MWRYFSLAIFSQLLLVCPLQANRPTRSIKEHGTHGHITLHEHEAHSVKDTSEGAEFTVWLPKWWMPEARDWGPAETPKSTEIEYFGQDQEDVHAINNYFHGREGLTYLEMGALDGVRWSNTLTFQRYKKSRGLLIEANPTSYKKLIANRPHDICVNAAICENFQDVHFAQADNSDVAGIVEFMPKTFQDQWYPTTKKIDEAIVIPCLPLSAILRKVNVRKVDLWSLDVEGAELKVLNSVDWQNFSADVIFVEADGHSKEKDQGVIDLLLAQGYIFDGLVSRNHWFHHSSFNPSSASV